MDGRRQCTEGIASKPYVEACARHVLVIVHGCRVDRRYRSHRPLRICGDVMSGMQWHRSISCSAAFGNEVFEIVILLLNMCARQDAHKARVRERASAIARWRVRERETDGTQRSVDAAESDAEAAGCDARDVDGCERALRSTNRGSRKQRGERRS
jgi:hypothetical protein